MKKILLIIALTLLCSFSVNAQEVETKAKAIDASKLIGKKISTEVPVVAQDVVTGTKSGPVAEMKKAVVDPNCRTSLTADEAYKSTADGNVNTFGATYSTVTPRTCEEKAALSEPVVASCHSCNCNPRYCLR